VSRRLARSTVVDGITYLAGEEVPADVRDQVPATAWDADTAATEPERAGMSVGDDPADFTVAEVQAYLAGADDAEKERVLAAEAASKNRSTITGS
jgi:hypothetical protein